MAMTLRKRVSRPEQHSDAYPVNKRSKRVARRSATRRRGSRRSSSDTEVYSSSDDGDIEDSQKKTRNTTRRVQIKVDSSSDDEVAEMPFYEKIREQRMRENREKMEKLGLFGLSQNIKPANQPRRAPQPRKKPSVVRSFAAPYELARKSSRNLDFVIGRRVAEMPFYEKIREQRMRENREKMEKLGLFGLSQNIKPANQPRRAPQPRKKPSVVRSFAAPYELARKSSRLKEMGQASYFKNEGTLESMGISVPEAWAPEAYTEDHEKLLGDCEKPWTLFVDGYEDGERLYDPLNGKMCHQCRQKTLGHFSLCRNCNSAQGQLCGDCLYMRYGENVLEVNENPNWSCPCCRDICNCSRCRRAKGWAPTVCVYQKVIDQGYKSIAHYVIQRRSAQTKPEDDDIVHLDSNVDPAMTSYSAPQIIDSDDTSDGSADDELEGYNSDSSEEAEPKKRPSLVVDDEEEGGGMETSNKPDSSEETEPKKRPVVVLDDEEGGSVEMSNREKEMVYAEMKDAERSL